MVEKYSIIFSFSIISKKIIFFNGTKILNNFFLLYYTKKNIFFNGTKYLIIFSFYTIPPPPPPPPPQNFFFNGTKYLIIFSFYIIPKKIFFCFLYFYFLSL